MGTRLFFWLQRVRLVWLLVMMIAVTGVFAAIYAALDLSNTGNGLRRPDHDLSSWFDYIYFSVVTEATLGYGDISPVGSSRFVACIQVFVGVLMAGVVVAKMTSQALNELLEIGHALSGIWVDIATLPDGVQVLGLVEFASESGTLFFRGSNFTSDGHLRHTFSCQLQYHDWPHYLVFHYDEAHGQNGLTSGQTTVTLADWISGKPHTFVISIKDKSLKKSASACGWRVIDKGWLKKLRRHERDAALLRELFQHYSNTAG